MIYIHITCTYISSRHYHFNIHTHYTYLPGHCRFARTLSEVEIGPHSNFVQYDLMPPLDLVRCDNAHPVWKTGGVLDAIICDPPYGVRAGARKTGAREDKV